MIIFWLLLVCSQIGICELFPESLPIELGDVELIRYRYLDLMAPFGHIYPLTISMEPLKIPYLPLVVKELSINGSCSSTPEELQKMLEFAALHKIKPVIQQFPMSVAGIEEAFKKLEAGEVRYRGVLKA